MAPALLSDDISTSAHVHKDLNQFPLKQPLFPHNAETEAYAISQDEADPLRPFREKFIIPTKSGLKHASIQPQLNEPGRAESDECIYFCGNSLGLQPKATASYLQTQLQTWSSLAVTGHFTQPAGSPLKPWQNMAEFAAEQCSRIVGAKPEEVAIANTLTVNLHLLMASFYRPEGKRCKILLEGRAFPSDHVSFSWKRFLA
jgi:kynureninase